MRASPSDMLDDDSQWHRKRIELTDKLVAIANELITHTGACRIAIPSGDIEVTIERKDYASIRGDGLDDARDAARYRWLRDGQFSDPEADYPMAFMADKYADPEPLGCDPLFGPRLDAAIDAAMEKNDG